MGAASAIATVARRADACASPRDGGDRRCAAPQFPEQPPLGELSSPQGHLGDALTPGDGLVLANQFSWETSLTRSSDFESFNTAFW